jgi:hypothetical protein
MQIVCHSYFLSILQFENLIRYYPDLNWSNSLQLAAYHCYFDALWLTAGSFIGCKNYIFM